MVVVGKRRKWPANDSTTDAAFRVAHAEHVPLKAVVAMTEAQKAAFIARLNVTVRLQGLRNELIEVSRTEPAHRLEALLLEAVSVAKSRGDDDAKRKLETVARRVLDRHYMPTDEVEDLGDGESVNIHHEAPRQIRFPEAVRLLAYSLSLSAHVVEIAEHNYEKTRWGIIEYVAPSAMHWLRRYAEHWPGGAVEGTIAEAIIEAVTDNRRPSLVASVLRAWGATDLAIKNAITAVRRQK